MTKFKEYFMKIFIIYLSSINQSNLYLVKDKDSPKIAFDNAIFFFTYTHVNICILIGIKL